MFGNWINPVEPIRLLQRIRRDPALRQRILRALHLNGERRIISSWSQSDGPPVHWLDIPMVQDRVNSMMSGELKKPYQRYVAEKYWQPNGSSKALSLGCGSGGKELAWAETGCFEVIDAYDISENRILTARTAVRETPFRKMIQFRVGNVQNLQLPPESYDAVLFDHSLHHFSSLDKLLSCVREVLKPGGMVVANEFIGPSRFQWSARQIEVVNGLLTVFPRRYLTRWDSKESRDDVWRPSKLAMWVFDPSEAIESSDIVPLMDKHFEVLEQNGYGGAILHLLFSGIAHHFASPDRETERLLMFTFAVEDSLLESKELNHDFALLIARRRN